MVERLEIGKHPEAHICINHNLLSWKVEIFKISTEPNFEEKLVDVSALNLHPREQVIVFSFDHESQVRTSIAPSRSCP
jgi:hypothetical protein